MIGLSHNCVSCISIAFFEFPSYHIQPNYPETLFKMVMYPVSNMVVSSRDVAKNPAISSSSVDPLFKRFFLFHQGLTARSLLGFVNEKTQSKFLITNSLDKVCEELGWNQHDVDECGGITEFMHKHEKVGDDFTF